MSKMKRNDSLLNIESILSSPSPEHNENFNISTNSNFGSSHATSPPKLVFHRARHSADYDHFMSPPLTSSLPPPTPLDPYSSNYHTDSLPNYYEIAIKQHQLIAQQQEFARLYVNPNSSTTNSKTNLSLASIFIPPSLYESESSSEATYECQKEKSALQGREEEEIGIFSPISQNSSGYSVDLTGLTSSPGIPLIGDSFEVPSSPNGDPLMPTMDSPATSSVELTRKFSHKEYTSTSLEQDEDPSTPTSRSRSAPPKRRRVKPGSNPNLQASLDSPSMSTEISDSQGSSQAKISGDKEEEDDEYEDCEEHEETVPEIQINNHHLPINESDPFFNIPLRDIMHSSMISTHHLSHDADEEFQILSETQNLDLSSNENIDQGFSEESKTELDHTTDVSSILESPMTPALKSAPPVFNNQRTSLSFDDCLPIESELPVISEDVNEEDARKHAQSISECETIRQKSLEQDFPSEPEESPPEDEPVILKKEDHLGLPEEYLSVPEESNQESSSQEEEDLFPMDKLSLEERGLIAHPRSASDHILSSRMQRKSVEFEETIELHKEPELEPSVEFRKKAPSSPHRVDRCKSHIILGTTPSLNLPKEPSIDVDDILSTSSPMDRKLSTSTPSIADIEGNQFTLPSYSKEIQTPVLTRKKVIREKDLERPKTIGSSLSAQPSMKKKEKDEKKSNTAPATMDPKIVRNSLYSSSMSSSTSSSTSTSSSSSSSVLKPLCKSTATKSSVSISSLVASFTHHRQHSDSNIMGNTPGRRSFKMKFQSLFSSSERKSSPENQENGCTPNGEVGDFRKGLVKSDSKVKLKKGVQKNSEIPSAPNGLYRQMSENGLLAPKTGLSLHHMLLGMSRNTKSFEDDLPDGPGPYPCRSIHPGSLPETSSFKAPSGIPIPLGNGVVLRNMPKIRRPHSKVSSMPVIEKITVDGPNVRHSLASVQESPHEAQEASKAKFEDMVKKYLEDVQEKDPDFDPMKTPTRAPSRLRRTQSCRSEKTLNRLRKGSLIPDAGISPYKNYTLTTPRRRGVGKRRVAPKRRKSLHSSMVEGTEAEILLRQVQELKERQEKEMREKESQEKKERPKSWSSKSSNKLDRGAKPKVKSWLEWSIRLNKKKNKDTRSLSNFMNSPLPDKKVSVTSMERKISSIENYDKVQGLPDDLKILNDTVRSSRSSDRSPLTPSTFQEDEFAFENGFKIPEFEKPKWIDLQLWKEEDPAWTATHSNLKLTSNEKKRQNIIHEFYYTEKQHCQMIVFLQQAYHYGLKNNRILHDDEIAGLIPDVLDSLLVFHLQLLRKIRRRQHENFTVEKISDIVCEEFENGPQTTSAINAYTLFCSHREEAIRRFNHYSGKYSKFKEYMEFCDGLKEGKNKTFKEKLLQIASRLTKYPVLMEQIAKYDLSEHKEESKRAQHAVKQFALKVDRELTKIELNKRWDQLRQKLEMTSVGRLLKEPFTVSDLVNQDPNDCRKVVSLGAVKMQDVKTGVKVELAMVLFDDIIVLFQEKNGILQFFKSNEHASVIPLQTLIPREMERTNEIMLVVTAKECPDMYRLIFGNKSDVRNWIQAIKSARENAPKYVRRSYGTQKVESANQMGSENDPEEIAYNEKISAWQKELDAIFAKRQEDEELLRTYMNTRMKFFDDVRAHFKKFPVKPVKDPHLIPGSSKAKIEKIKESKDLEKMRKIVNLKFAELKNFRRSALDSLVEAAQKARDSDLTSYFDDLFDLSHPDQTTTSSSEENEVDGGSQRQKKPRRVRTFAGETSSLQQNAIRRHTTLPKMDPNAIEEEKEYEMLHEAEMKQLPLKMSGKSRRAASKIIEENIDLRLENARLKNEVARQELLLISMKSKKQPLDSAEKLEQLRMRQEEIRAEEKKVKLEKELLEKEYELKMAEIAEKEAALMAREESLSLRRENSPSHTLYMRNGERPNSSPTIPVHLATQTILTDKKKLNKNNKK